MLKFIRSKGNQQPTAERQKLQKELYAFRKVSQSATRSAAIVANRKTKKSSKKYFTRLHYELFRFYLYETHFLSARNTERSFFPLIKRAALGVPATVFSFEFSCQLFVARTKKKHSDKILFYGVAWRNLRHDV